MNRNGNIKNHNRQNYKQIFKLLFFIGSITLFISMIFRSVNYNNELSSLQKTLVQHYSQQEQWRKQQDHKMKQEYLASNQLQNNYIMRLLHILPQNLPKTVHLTQLTLTSLKTTSLRVPYNQLAQTQIHSQLKGHFTHSSELQQWLEYFNNLTLIHQLNIKSIQNRQEVTLESGVLNDDQVKPIEKNSLLNSFELSFTLGASS